MSWDDRDIERLVRPGEGLVSPEIFHDRELFDIESRKVFMRTWLYVGHESQLAKRGDFISTYMGLNPVLVVRQRDGGAKVMLNACRHRGMKVCRVDGGNTRAFTCTYHGWSYGLDGALASVPQEKEFYDDKQTLGWRVNQILTGMHWSEDPPSRTRHLVTNVVLRRTDDPDEFRVRSSFPRPAASSGISARSPIWLPTGRLSRAPRPTWRESTA